ncbi:glycosyltransferase family 2 protein [Pseudoalteromonas xiamenensis]
MAKVSIIVPCYNVENFIDEALDSILNQTFNDFEVLCLDDASTDSTYSKICQWATQDSRIVHRRNCKNLGLIGTLNELVKWSDAYYLIRMDPDDISEPTRIERLVNEAESYSADVVGSSYTMIDSEGKEVFNSALLLPTQPKSILYTTAFNSPMAHATVLYRQEYISKFLYGDSCFAAEDYDLWVRTINESEKEILFRNINLPLYRYRIHGSSASNMNRIIQINSHLACVLRFKKENLPKSYNVGSSYIKIMANIADDYSFDSLKNAYLEIRAVYFEFFEKNRCSDTEILEIKNYTSEYALLLIVRCLSNASLASSIKIIISVFYLFIKNPYFLTFHGVKSLIRRSIGRLFNAR